MKTSHKNLTRRYLIWAYKSTKESFERIERKTTQLVVDEYILKQLGKGARPKGPSRAEYEKLIQEFEQYIASKKADELKLKFSNAKTKSLHPQYVYLKNRLSAIEEAIKHFLGAGELKKIEGMFEEEFIERIWKAKDH